MNNKYIGHNSQLYGVEEHRLVGGKGDGMRLFQVKNGRGLEFTVSADRCADISRLSYKGDNFAYFSPSGYVGPQYYDDKGNGFLKSFTAGFLTTCGLTNVGAACVDDGQELPLHGTISNCPAENIYAVTTDDEIIINANMNDGAVFAHKLVLNRQIICSMKKNEIKIIDKVRNLGSEKTPLLLLYHMNIGYPLLDESAKLYVSSKEIVPRNEHAAKDLDRWAQMMPPQAGFQEQCYFHRFDSDGIAAIYNPNIEKGLAIKFNPKQLDYLTEWKMLGEKDYVLGLEPGNCHPDGRDVMRKQGNLKFINPDEEITFEVVIEIIDSESQFAEFAK